ncbi:Alpha/Beta hydrolase protein [Hygrophoropsis aurantiaca]|uniref:Alpha/Beta hydrolase protein n=1 Tax=Hygrophoropsis aurantiaca TaxID=72124 RepID=A0ACB8AGD3_9AGAM|nr:Alpha/Beta hydrolase protein [Hygrophoropsis aurantiaca]
MWLPTALYGILGIPTQTPILSPQVLSVPPNSTSFTFQQNVGTFSPKDMLELPRPGIPIANVVGDLALVPSSKYSFEDEKNHQSLVILPLDSVLSPLEVPLPSGGEAFWLDSRTVAHVVTTDNGDSKIQDLYTYSVHFEQGASSPGLSFAPPVLVGSFPTTTASSFRYSLSSGFLVFSAYVYADGDIYMVKANDKAYESRGNFALVYDSAQERLWDTWTGPKHKSLFSVRLIKQGSTWKLGNEYINTLQGTGLSSPSEPFGGIDDFDISDRHIVYTAADPKLPAAWHTRQGIYYVDFEGSKTVELTSGTQGTTTGPVFDRKGDRVAWVEGEEDRNMSASLYIVVYDLKANIRYNLTKDWDRTPSNLVFSANGDFLYFIAEDHARAKVFALPLPTLSNTTSEVLRSSLNVTPIALTESHVASGLQVIQDNRLLFAMSSLTSPNDAFELRHIDLLEEDIRNQRPNIYRGELVQLTTFTASHLRGKTLSEGEEFWFKGAGDRDIQGWLMKPPGYSLSDKKKWPIALLIHGGPESAWEDAWSTRWNPNVFANQGYFTVAINPTGSTSFGQNFTDDIHGDWGGRPFVDLRKGWQHVLDSYPQIDPERAVAAGASWGGYAINWIQGNPEFGFGFKALVCHDGVFDTAYDSLSSDVPNFFNREWGGKPWDENAMVLHQKFSPSNTVPKWSTPELIIHGSKDYRLAETEGIAPFHALQQLGIPSRLVIFPDENHWVLKPGNSLKWHYEVFRWFDRFVGSEI